MIPKRVIPVLLLKNTGLYKTRRFDKPVYIGDPINALKIFNEKEVDELVILDITATATNKAPNFEYLRDLSSECFMPLAYGGGVKTIQHIEQLIKLGVEKIIINSQAVVNPRFIREASDAFAMSSIVVSIDVKKDLFGRYRVYTHNGKKNSGLNPVEFAKEMAQQGAGEILINSIDRDGEMNGYDLTLIKEVSSAISIPVVASGGAGVFSDFEAALNAGAAAVAAGSMFVFHGKHRGVLITYPNAQDIRQL